MHWLPVILLLASALMSRIRVYLMFRTESSPALILRITYLGVSRSLHLPQISRDTDRFTRWYKSLSPQRRDAFFSAAPRLLALIRLTRLHAFSLHIHTCDAAHAALWHGALPALRQTLCLFHPHCRHDLFCLCAPQPAVRLDTVFSLRVDQLLRTALRFAWSYSLRRLKNCRPPLPRAA